MKTLWASLLLPWLIADFAIDVLCLPLMVTNIVLNEVTLLSGGFPVNEADVAIGQCGPLVSACLCWRFCSFCSFVVLRKCSQILSIAFLSASDIPVK